MIWVDEGKYGKHIRRINCILIAWGSPGVYVKLELNTLLANKQCTMR